MTYFLHSMFALIAMSSVTFAHGYLGKIRANNVDYKAWQVYIDRFELPQPVRATRPYRDNGPVDNFTTNEITCGNFPNAGPGGGPPAIGNDGTYVQSIPVKPGDKLTLIWDSWNIFHPGPVMTYLANCNGNCKTFKGDTGNVWVKFDQVAYNKTANPPWGSSLLTKQNATWVVTVPSTLAPGEYILRHEVLALQSAALRMGAQFYPSCAHLSVRGSGTHQLPSGVALPGAYDPDDTNGVHLHYHEVESGEIEYVAPGGAVWNAAAPQLNGL